MTESVNRNNNDSLVEQVAAELEKVQVDDTLPEFDFSGFRAAESKSISRTYSEPGALSVVNSKGNGKRLLLSDLMMTELNQPDTIQVRLAKDRIAFAKKFSDDQHSFPIRKDGKSSRRGIVYSYRLVEEITKQYDLDFSTRVSITFNEVKFQQLNGQPVAVITMKK